MFSKRLTSLLTLASYCLTLTSAHGAHESRAQVPLDADADASADWATRHMIVEHHISNFDPTSFFKLHDFDSDGVWEDSEIRRTYGLEDVSNKDVTEQRKQEVVSRVLELFDTNRDGFISATEWMAGIGRGEVLPDLGVCLGKPGTVKQETDEMIDRRGTPR